MKVDQLYEYLNYIRRKDPIGGSISIPELNLNFEIVAYQYFRKIIGLPSQYQKGARDPIIGKGLNDISEEKLRPLKVLPTDIIIDQYGYADYPSDYFRHGPCGYSYNDGTNTRNIQIPFVNDEKFEERNVTVLDPPSLTDPVANLHADKIRFLPITLTDQTVKLEYIKYPKSPVMGYVIDNDTAENIYVEHGAYIEILTPGTAGNTITVTSGGNTLGSYTVVAGDTVGDVMEGLRDSINLTTGTYGVSAVYDGDKVVLIDSTGLLTTLTTSPTGTITLNKTNFSDWSTQFDWEDDIESMNEIAELLLDRMGISNRDVNIIQWSEKEQAK